MQSFTKQEHFATFGITEKRYYLCEDDKLQIINNLNNDSLTASDEPNSLKSAGSSNTPFGSAFICSNILSSILITSIL